MLMLLASTSVLDDTKNNTILGKKIHSGGNKARAERTCTHKLTDRPVAEKRRSRKEMEQGGVDQMVGGQ